jgi:hypothetical protein
MNVETWILSRLQKLMNNEKSDKSEVAMANPMRGIL